MKIGQSPIIYFYYPNLKKETDLIDTKQRMLGAYQWTVQSYINLKKIIPCSLVTRLPSEGIIVAHSDHLEKYLKPNKNQFFICLKADRPPHVYAQTHVVENRRDMITYFKPFQKIYYLPHWISNIIPRDSKRLNKFENVTFIGNDWNLAEEFKCQKWQNQLNKLGLKWCVSEQRTWNDYREIDVVIAIRSFNAMRYHDKPAWKLYNAWHAGVPAIMGRESAYQAERKSDLDYIEVNSMEDTIKALRRLRDDIEYRMAIINNGKERSNETSVEEITKKWVDLIQSIAIPHYYYWRKFPEMQRRHYFMIRWINSKLYDSVQLFDRALYKLSYKYVTLR